MARYAKRSWDLPDKSLTWEHAEIAILMDIRDELREIKQALYGIRACPTTNAAVRAWADFGRELRRKERAKRKRAALKKRA